MKIAKGSDQALNFYNNVIDQLMRYNTSVRKSFTKGITQEEKIFIINALENKKWSFEAQNTWKKSVYVVKNITYDSNKNNLIIAANPDFHTKLREASINTWPIKITQYF